MLTKLNFCALCDNLIKLDRPYTFYQKIFDELFMLQIRNSQNDYLVNESIDDEIFYDMYDADMFYLLRIDGEDENNSYLCGECIEELRPYIFYLGETMYMLFPHDFDINEYMGFGDSDSDDSDSDSDSDEDDNYEEIAGI